MPDKYCMAIYGQIWSQARKFNETEQLNKWPEFVNDGKHDLHGWEFFQLFGEWLNDESDGRNPILEAIPLILGDFRD